MMQKNFLGTTELEVSQIGFGAYRVDERVQTHQEALDFALSQGVNLIDTSSNYTHGFSERLVGQCIAQKIQLGAKRSDYVVVSKVGYMQGETLERFKKENLDDQASLAKVTAQHWHCISPAFIQEQIDQSLARMQLETIDVYLLHNPEYILKHNNDSDIFYACVEQAFESLEEAVKVGKIKYYGVSCNDFGSEHHQVDLDRLWQCANSVSANNHFRVIECPLNLFESKAVIEGDPSLIEQAQKYGLGTLVNRPLNAFAPKRGLFRLASFQKSSDREALEKDLEKKLAALVQWEKEFKNIPLDEKIQPFFLGHVLYAEKENMTDILQWKDLYTYQIHPLLENNIKQLSAIDEIRTWLEAYVTQSMNLIAVFTQYLEHMAAIDAEAIALWLNQHSEKLKAVTTLSQKVLNLYASIDGVDCVLVGMREKRYVEDALNLLGTLDDQSSKGILKAFCDLQKSKNP